MALKYVQTNTFYQAGSGSIIGATSIVLTSFTDIYGNILTMTDFGAKGYITLEPDTTNEESATFTGVTANTNSTYTLTGVSTALAKSAYTETSGTIRGHSGGTKVVVSDTTAFWNTFPNKLNDETITGQWTFTNTPIVPGTVSDASTTVKGVSKTSVAPALSTNPIVVGVNDIRVPIGYAVDSVGSDSYAISPAYTITSYVAGQSFTFKAGTANTGASSLNVSGLGAIAIKKNVSLDLATGDILLNQIVTVIYDGTFMQFASTPSTGAPLIRTFTAQNLLGSVTTQFTITNQGSNIFRYTFNGTGTNPGTLSSLVTIGGILSVQSSAMNAANVGIFPVTGSGAAYFEVTNASGVAESNKALTNGYLDIGTVYTPTTGTKYLTAEILGAGFSGTQGTSNSGGSGGGAGGYVYKLLSASAATGLQAIAGPAPTTTPSSADPYGISAFGISLISFPGKGVLGGAVVGGDISYKGAGAGSGVSGTSVTDAQAGASSRYGGGGSAGNSTVNGNASGYGAGGGGGLSGGGTGTGTQGVVIITEYF